MNTSHLIILLRITPANRPSFYQHLYPKEERYFSSFSWPPVARHRERERERERVEACKLIYMHGSAIMISVKLINENIFLDGKPILCTTVNNFFSIS